MTREEQDTMKAIQMINKKIPEVTLRDLFAMNAMNALINARDNSCYSYIGTVQDAYNLADTMLEVRNM